MVYCSSQFGGYEGDVGFVAEIACGDPQAGIQYTADDSLSGGPVHSTTTTLVTNPAPAWPVNSLAGYTMFVDITAASPAAGEFVLIASNTADTITHAALSAAVVDLDLIWVIPPLDDFGFVQNVSFDIGQDEGTVRRVGDQRIQHQEAIGYNPSVSIDTLPTAAVLLRELRNFLGDTAPPSTWQNHTQTRIIERGVVRTNPAGEFREVMTMAKPDELNLDIPVSDFMKLVEVFKGQYMAHSESKVYVEMDGTSESCIGPDPAGPDKMYDTPLKFDDASLEICEFQEVTGLVAGPGVALPALPAAPAPLPGDIDGLGTHINFMFAWINGVPNVVAGYNAGTRVTTLTDAMLGGETYVLYYWSIRVPGDFTNISLALKRSQEQSHGVGPYGIWPYEVNEKMADIGISISLNFDADDEILELMQDNYLHLIITVTDGVTVIPIRLYYFKFKGTPPPYSTEDLIAFDLEGECEDIVVD